MALPTQRLYAEEGCHAGPMILIRMIALRLPQFRTSPPPKTIWLRAACSNRPYRNG